MVVVLGDHGEEFLEHNGFGHGHDVFQEQIWVPLVFLWPDEERFAAMPARIDRPVSLLDVLPTLLVLFDLPVGRDMDGKPMLDLFDPSIGPPREIATHDSEAWRRAHEAFRVDSRDLEERLEQLRRLGYVR